MTSHDNVSSRRSQLRRNRNGTSPWLGQGFSQLGDAVSEVTLPVWVGLLTGSPRHVATVAAAQLLPALIASPVAGVFADRRNPRTTMLVCDFTRGLLIGLLLLVPQGMLKPATSMSLASAWRCLASSSRRPRTLRCGR